MKRFSLLLSFLIVLLVSTVHADIIGHGITLEDHGFSDDNQIFVGINNHLKFTFTDTKLIISNNGNTVGNWWDNFGNYTFSGIHNLTAVTLVTNHEFHGTILSNFKFNNDSLTLDMSHGNYDLDHTFGQRLVFNLSYDQEHHAAPVPEPNTLLLFGTGIVMVCSVIRRKCKVVNR